MQSKKIRSSTKFKNWFMNRVINAQWIHKSKKTRVHFILIYWIIILLLIGGFCAVSALLFIDGLRFLPNGTNDDTNWYAGINHRWSFIVAIVGLVIFFIITFLLGLYIPILYKWSKMLYFQTDEYKQKVLKYTDANLGKYSNREIKWLYKLGYISKTTYLYYKKK